MNNKTTQAVLGIVVLLIWGTLIYNFFNYGDGAVQEPTFTVTTPAASTNAIAVDAATNYELSLQYRDPFTGKNSQSSGKSKKRSSSSQTKAIKPPPAPEVKKVTYPKITYRGYLLTNNRVTSVRVDLNGKTYTLKQGQLVDDVKILSMARDSIQVEYVDGVIGVIERRRN